MTWRPGYAHLSAAKSSMPTISANGWTVPKRRIQRTPTAKSMDTALRDHLRSEQDLFPRRRDARLQLLHGPRSAERRHADHMHQLNPGARWQANRQYSDGGNTRPD